MNESIQLPVNVLSGWNYSGPYPVHLTGLNCVDYELSTDSFDLPSPACLCNRQEVAAAVLFNKPYDRAAPFTLQRSLPMRGPERRRGDLHVSSSDPRELLGHLRLKIINPALIPLKDRTSKRIHTHIHTKIIFCLPWATGDVQEKPMSLLFTQLLSWERWTMRHRGGLQIHTHLAHAVLMETILYVLAASLIQKCFSLFLFNVRFPFSFLSLYSCPIN